MAIRSAVTVGWSGWLCGDFEISGEAVGLGYGKAFRFQPFQMELDCFPHSFFDLFLCCPSSNATIKVGREGGISCFSFFNNDQVSSHFAPACLNILFNVPGAKSSPDFPAMVISPDLS